MRKKIRYMENRNENTAYRIQCKLLKFYKLNKTVFFMGNKGCKMCQTTVKGSEIITNVSALCQDDFKPSQLPNDQDFNQWLQIRKWDVAQGQIYRTCGQSNKYFIGNWKKKVPIGRCLIYEPKMMLLDAFFVNGIPEGKAEVCFIDQACQYKGMLKQGSIEGFGKFIDHKQNFSFEGEWMDSRIQSGKLFLRKDKNISWVVFQNFVDGYGKIQYKDGQIYQGQIDVNTLCPNGKGCLTYPVSSYKTFYEGQFLQGKFHNHGKCQFKNGQIYIGQFKNGKKQGKGKFIFTSGKLYEGEWVQGKQNGQGTLYSKNREVLAQGMWKQGQIIRQPVINAKRDRRFQNHRPRQLKTSQNLKPNKRSPSPRINICASLEKATREFGRNLIARSPNRNRISISTKTDAGN